MGNNAQQRVQDLVAAAVPAGPYYFVKNEISESAPRPTPLVFDMLSAMYAPDGPVANVYAKLGVQYQSQPFLKLIGNELVIDKEAELHTLLPAWSYFKKNNGKPARASFTKFGISLGNWWKMARWSVPDPVVFVKRLQESWDNESSAQTVTDAWHRLLRDYELTFEINLWSSMAVQQLERLMAKEPVPVAAVLGDVSFLAEPIATAIPMPTELWQGNTIDIADAARFVVAISQRTDSKVKRWFDGLPTIKQRMFQPFLERAVGWQRLREYGRWLLIKRLQPLRGHITAMVAAPVVYFAQLNEMLTNKVDQSVCEDRRQQYASYAKVVVPRMMASFPLPAVVNQGVGLAPGMAEGVLTTREDLSSSTPPCILYTDMLTPDLTECFGQITGIVTKQGSVLSHVAIMAREAKLPVVLFPSLGTTVLPGERVAIDGNAGTVKSVYPH